jgi:hypothetical protein
MILHHATWDTLEEMAEGLLIFGVLPPHRQYVHALIRRMQLHAIN